MHKLQLCLGARGKGGKIKADRVTCPKNFVLHCSSYSKHRYQTVRTVVAYKRLKTIENCCVVCESFQLYSKCLFGRGIFGVLDRWFNAQGMWLLLEVVAHGGLVLLYSVSPGKEPMLEYLVAIE